METGDSDVSPKILSTDLSEVFCYGSREDKNSIIKESLCELAIICYFTKASVISHHVGSQWSLFCTESNDLFCRHFPSIVRLEDLKI